MSRVRDSLSTLASRGKPRGADQIFSAASTALGTRQSGSLAETKLGDDLMVVSPTTQPRRPWVAFAAGFGVALAMGLLLFAVVRPADNAATGGAVGNETGELKETVETGELEETVETGELEETVETGELEEIVEPHNILVGSFGDDWAKQAQWEIETSTDVTTSCLAFDELLLIDDWGGVEAVWSNGTSRLSQRVADLGFEAQSYLDTARDLPDLCPTIALRGGEIGVSRPELDVGVVYELTAFPIPDPASDGLIPEFDAGSRGWVITMRRANVISVLMIEANGDLSPSDVEDLASIARGALEAAEPEAIGPISRPERPEPQIPGTVPGVTLTFDDVVCRNGGTIPVGDVEWQLLDPVPLEWRGLGPQQGDLTIVDGENAAFTAADGTELRVTIGAYQQECFGWDDDEG